MRLAPSLAVLVAVSGAATPVAAAAENPLARRSGTEAWDAEQRKLKIATGVWWGTFAVLNVSGIPACVVASRDLNDGAAAWCGIASIGSVVTLAGGVVYSVRLLRHNKTPTGQRYCWPDCRVGRVRWDTRRPLVLRF